MDAPTRFTSGRSRPPAAPADEDDEWDAVIARAKARAATLRAPRARVPERTTATLDALMRGGLHSAASLRPVLAARRPAEEDMVTPPPVTKRHWAGGPLSRSSK
ncbi:MAG TPA: hypothetical protein VKZ18_19925 [Polyangia bacterium]|nr:hypothetical protein [Polyangia bacterium]